MCVALFHMNLKYLQKTVSCKKLELIWSRLREPPSSFFLFFELTLSKMSNYSAPREQCSLLSHNSVFYLFIYLFIYSKSHHSCKRREHCFRSIE